MGSRSQTIGPYTLEKRLGAGGMGEVYRAYDRRLDRWVALKLIRPEHMENATARERFRREARAAARLSHSAIVQIYDIVEGEESDAIILELVEGEPLSRKIARGPLPVEEAVRLGRQIAEGLAAAHARGIIHRDLKPENVMVTSEGHAKILDFGLAKRLEEASLTEDHKVLGTFRSMSPEQAQGLPLDHRSDLFSFGILLYEMLSGQSPFAGGSTLETLTRICDHRQTSLRKLNPGIPGDLSNLIDHLLEKDPNLRPRSAREAFATLEESRAFPGEDSAGDQATLVEGLLRPEAPGSEAVPLFSLSPGGLSSHALEPVRRGRHLILPLLAVAVLILASIFVLYLRFRTPPEPMTVAVSKPVIEEGKDLQGVDLLASGLRIALLGTLTTLEEVSPLAPELVDPVAGPPTAIARATAAKEVLTSRITCPSEICQISLYRIRGEDGRLLWTQSFRVPLNNLNLVTEAVQTHLSKGYKDHPRISGFPKFEVREADYIEYLRLWREFDSTSGASQSLESLITRIEEIRRNSPRFLEASLFHAQLLEQRFYISRDPEDLERSLEVLQEARKRFSVDPRPIIRLIQLSLAAQRLDSAEAAIRDLERLDPGNPEILIQRARLLQRRGHSDQARVLGREAVERAPAWQYLFWAADLEMGSGDIAAAREYLEDLLRRYPGHYAGRSLLGQLELMNGSPKRAVILYSDLVRRSPGFEEMSNLGLAHFLLRQYRQAEILFRRAYSLQPRNGAAALNLADTLLLLGRKEEARKLYQEVLDLTVADPAADDSWQHQTIYGQALAHLGRSREAVEAVQKALRLAPDNPQVAYETSLVYALVGDRTSALTNAGKARASGFDSRWFTFPWFDPLRSAPDFQALLSPSSTGGI